MRRATFLFALAMAAGVASPAHAAFNVCNKTGQAVRTAIGRFDGTNWSSEGWWTVAPKSCTAILTGPLQGRFYYLYATDGAAGIWEGKTYFCVAPDKRYRAVGRSACAKRGF